MKYSLVINAGSATYKYALFLKKKKIHTFLYQKEGENIFTFSKNKEAKEEISRTQFENSLSDLKKREEEMFSEIGQMAFRVVHGGSVFTKPTFVTPSVIKKLEKLNQLALLHNPFSLRLIKQAQKLFPKCKKLLVFDTAFHSQLPVENKTYALPKNLQKKFGIKRYGFHGIVCSSIVRQMGWRLSKRTIICHLGSGCSVTALLKGKSIDTSMGFTPLEGLIMGTRAGDLDPGLVVELEKKIGSKKLEEVLNKSSGLKGLAGASDMREVIKMAEKGNRDANLAIEIFCRKAAKVMASQVISLGGVDLIIFSGGIGENSPLIRQKICEYLSPLRVGIHFKRNQKAKPRKRLHTFFSKVKVNYVQADEQVEMNMILQEHLF